MSRWQRKSKWVEILLGVVVGFFICAMVNWTFRSFALMIYVTVLCAGFAIAAARRRGLVGFAVACFPLSACLLSITAMLPNVFPWQLAKVPAASYADVPLVKILADLALEKDDAPTWRFQVATRDLATRMISIEIPADERLGSTLQRIAAAADAELDWQWHKMSGNEPTPICATFNFRPDDDGASATTRMPAVTVSLHGTFWNETTRGASFVTRPVIADK